MKKNLPKGALQTRPSIDKASRRFLDIKICQKTAENAEYPPLPLQGGDAEDAEINPSFALYVPPLLPLRLKKEANFGKTAILMDSYFEPLLSS